MPFAEFLTFFQQTDNLWDTVRRLEDVRVKVELEKEFFESLKYWYQELLVIDFDETNGLSKGELIVLLLNKIIFIKTLEDYGLILFRFLEDLYFTKRLSRRLSCKDNLQLTWLSKNKTNRQKQ